MVSAGVCLRSLMALLAPAAAEMSMRHGRLFDTAIRTEYERALDPAKACLEPLPGGQAASHPPMAGTGTTPRS